MDVDANNPSRILEVSERPVLDIGTPGSFDENGVVRHAWSKLTRDSACVM